MKNCCKSTEPENCWKLFLLLLLLLLLLLVQLCVTFRLSTITGLDYWTGLLDSPKLQNTTRSVQNWS